MTDIAVGSRQINGTLVIIEADYESDVLEYTCEASNIVDTTERSAFLTVHGELPPTPYYKIILVKMNDCITIVIVFHQLLPV